MVAVSFVLVLALMSSTVVAQPGTNVSTGLFACFKRQPTPHALLKYPLNLSIEWIPLDEETPTPTSDEDPADIESTVEMSSEDAVKAAVDCLGIPFYPGIAPVKESYETDNGNILVWSFHLRDNPTTQWIEVKVNANHCPENFQASPNGWTDGFELKGNNAEANLRKA
ncbi:hypothetical protein BASA60_002347 [Batrachochytrium salamandrivorans]|nr:hypothetical protein BASA60_002347 [Batrachochytrium salamandrivorans]